MQPADFLIQLRSIAVADQFNCYRESQSRATRAGVQGTVPKKEYFLEVFKAFLGIEPYGYPDPKEAASVHPKVAARCSRRGR
jgi:hypothetical protein